MRITDTGRSREMIDNNYVQKLEHVIKQMLTPLKGIPFPLIIESICDKKVIKYDPGNVEHLSVLNTLIEVAKWTCEEINKKGIIRTRANEVGNDIEEFVIDSLVKYKLQAYKPKTMSGKVKSTGYPDIEFKTPDGTNHYIECKTYSESTISSSMRSFYLSPSEDFKVTHDAIHFIIGFEIYKENNNIYKTKGWKILDAFEVECDVKYEFNSDNLRLYRPHMILAEGII
jgi:hypothetical protein